MDYDSKIVSLHLFLILRAFSRCSCRGRCRFLRKRLESLRACTKEQEDKEAIRCGQQFHIPLKSLSKRQLSILAAGQGTTLGCAVEGYVAAKNDRQTFPARALLHDPSGRGWTPIWPMARLICSEQTNRRRPAILTVTLLFARPATKANFCSPWQTLNRRPF